VQNSLASHACDFSPPMGTCHAGQVGREGGSARARVMLCDVPGCSTVFFFFHALPPAVAPAGEVTGAAAGAVGGGRVWGREGESASLGEGWAGGGAFEYILILLNTSETTPYELRIESFSTGCVLRNLILLFRFLVH